jgi:hypothetical protein
VRKRAGTFRDVGRSRRSTQIVKRRVSHLVSDRRKSSLPLKTWKCNESVEHNTYQKDSCSV